jgi:hypothetical protein
MKTAIWALLLLMSFSAAADDNALYGTWRLTSFTRTVVATGEVTDYFGKAPSGFLNYGRDGRMMVIIVKDGRLKPADAAKMTDQEAAELNRSMFSYGGTFTFDGRTVTHHVDISWNQAWTGTDLVRDVKIEGRRLTLTTRPIPNAADNGKPVMAVFILTWEKVE